MEVSFYECLQGLIRLKQRKNTEGCLPEKGGKILGKKRLVPLNPYLISLIKLVVGAFSAPSRTM